MSVIASPALSRRFFLGSTAVVCLAAGLGGLRPARAAGTIKPDAKSALIVVDVQNCFIDGGTLPVKGGAEVVPVINKLAASFENIVVTQDWHTPGHASFASAWSDGIAFSAVQFAYGPQTLWPDHCVQGTPGAAFHPSLLVDKAEVVVIAALADPHIGALVGVG